MDDPIIGTGPSFDADELVLYGLVESPEHAHEYLPQSRWQQVAPAFSRPRARVLLDDKWVFDRYATGSGLPTPRTYGYLHPRHGVSADLTPLRTAADLARVLGTATGSGVVAKPARGLAGRAIVVIDRWEGRGQHCCAVLSDGSTVSMEQLMTRLSRRVRGSSGFVLQQRCLPTDWYGSTLPGPTVLRLVTFVPDGGDPIVQAAVVFAGRADHAIWSWKGGGVCIGVDLATGALRRGRTLPRFGTQWCSRHPDGDTAFEGLRLPGWDHVVDLARRAALATPGIRLAAWEVLLTPEGPVLLEGNLVFGMQTLQTHVGGLLAPGGIGEQWARVAPALLPGHRP